MSDKANEVEAATTAAPATKTPEQLAIARRQTEEWLESVSLVDRVTPEQMALIKNTCAKDATPEELRLFVTVSAQTRLNPLLKQIHFVKRWDSRAVASDGKRGAMVGAFQVGIDGFRIIAERTGKYAGKVSEEWCGPDGKWVDVWLSNEHPFAARVTGRRKDWPEPVRFIARWSAYVQMTKDGEITSMWRQRDAEQLAKCAEAGMLRIVAPNDLSGLYTPEEIGGEEESSFDRPLNILPSGPSPKAEEAKAAAAAAESALSVPAGAGEKPSEESVATAPEKPAEPAEPDYVAEAKAIMSEVTGIKFNTRGGLERWARQRDALVVWGTRSGLAPAVIDDRAVYAMAVAYRNHKSNQREDQAGEAATDAAAAGKDDAPAAEPAAPATTVASGPEWPGLVEALKIVGTKAGRSFVTHWEGRWWLNASDFLDHIGASDPICLEEPSSEQFFNLIREKMREINASIDAKTARGPAAGNRPPVL